MKYFITLLVGVLVLASAATVSAAEYASGEEVSVSADKTITNDYYAAGADVVIDGTINGDLYVAGGRVRVNGTVTGDVVAAGGDITIKGPVNDDVRVTGGQVRLSGPIAGDLLAFGGNIELDTDASVAGDTTVAGGQLTLSGNAAKVQAYVGALTVGSTAAISGNLTYMAEEDAKIESGSTIVGSVTKQASPVKKDDRTQRAQAMIFSTIMTIIMAGLFLWLFPNKTAAVVAQSRSSIVMNMLIGVALLLGIPVLSIVLMITVIGAPVAVGLIFAYIVLLYLAKLVAVILVGAWLERFWDKGDVNLNFLTVIVGALVLSIVSLIPYMIGVTIVFAVVLIALGGLVKFNWDLVAKLRNDKKI